MADCVRHMVNTWLAGGERSEKSTLKGLYSQCDSDLPFYARDPSDLNASYLSISKGTCVGQEVYGKGFGRDFASFTKAEFAHVLILLFERWDHGQRQDWITLSGRTLYWMRPFLVSWLRNVFWKDANVLRDCLFITLTDEYHIAGTKVRALVHVKFTEPWTQLLCSSGKNCLDAAPVVQAVLKCCNIDKDRFNSTFLNRDWDAFGEFNTPGSQYAQWRINHNNEETTTHNGTRVLVNQVIEAELFDPKDPSNSSEVVLETTIVLLEAWLAGMKNTLQNGQGKRYIGSGDMANPTPEQKAAFKDTWATTNTLEGGIGDLKHHDRRVDNISAQGASALAVASKNNLFGSPDAKYRQNRSDKRAKCAPEETEVNTTKLQRLETGRLKSLPTEQQEAIISVTRQGTSMEVTLNQSDLHRAQNQLTVQRREEEEGLKAKQAKAYVKAEDAMEVIQPITDEDVQSKSLEDLQKQLDSATSGLSVGKQNKLLKQLLERYVNGMGHRDLKPKSYTSSTRSDNENIQYLKTTAISAFEAMKGGKRKFLSQAAIPEMKVRDLGHAGPTSKQRKQMAEAFKADADIESTQKRASELRAKSAAEKEEKKKKKAKKEEQKKSR